MHNFFEILTLFLYRLLMPLFASFGTFFRDLINYIGINKIAKLLLFIFIFILYLQIFCPFTQVGAADNGDFPRITNHFSPKPMKFTVNWPKNTDPQWFDRFFHYWIPFWDLDISFKRIFGHKGNTYLFSTTLLLWAPGILLNYFLFSKDILYMPFITLMPCFILIFVFFRILEEIIFLRTTSNCLKFILLLMIGGGVFSIVLDFNYIRYLNSFYMEPAAITLLPLEGYYLYKWNMKRSNYYFFMVILISIILSLSKFNYFYFSALCVLFLLQPISSFRKATFTFTILLIIVAVTYKINKKLFLYPGLNKNYYYFGLFLGVLPLSEKPEWHLEKLGFKDVSLGELEIKGIDTPADLIDNWKIPDALKYYTVDILAKHTGKDLKDGSDVLKIMLLEPKIIGKMILKNAENMNKIKDHNAVFNKKKYLDQDPNKEFSYLEFISPLKEKIFPKGKILILLTIVQMAILLRYCFAKNNLIRSLSKVSTFMLINCIVQFILTSGIASTFNARSMLIANYSYDFSFMLLLILITITIYDKLRFYHS